MAEIDTEYLNKNEPFRLVKLIDGETARIDTPAIVGYCHNEEHKGIVTVTGRIDGIYYTSDRVETKKGIISRFFK